MPSESLTYRELAARWATTPEASRKRVKLRRLPVSIGNDGLARVRVDFDDFPPVRPALPAPDATRTGRSGSLEAMERQITDLRAELAARPQKAVLEALEGRIIDLQSDRDAWRAQAERLATPERPPASLFARLFGRVA